MTIRGQNIRFLVPVFLVAGLLIGGLKWAADTRMLESGGQEQIRTFAVAIREFLQSRESLSAATGLAAVNPERLSKDLARVQQLFDLRNVTGETSPVASLLWPDAGGGAGAPGVVILHPETKEIIFSSAEDNPALEESAVQQLVDRGGLRNLNGEVWIPAFDVSTDSPRSLWAFCELSNRNGVYGVLAVQYDGSWIRNEVRATIIEIGVGILVSLLAGFVIALFLAAILSRSILNLSEAAGKAADGDYQVSIRTGIIEEFNDLGNTFRTMTSLLFDTLDRIRKTLIEQEQFRNTDDLLSTFRQEAYSVVDEDSWLQARMGPVRTHPRGYFYRKIEHGDGLLFIMGWVHESSEPDDLVASAFCRYIEARTREEELESVLSSGFESFGVRKLIAVHLLPDPIHGVRYDLDSSRNSNVPERTEFEDIPAKGMVLHTLNEAFGQRIETALHHMESQNAAEIHQEIRSISLPGEEGIALYIRRNK